MTSCAEQSGSSRLRREGRIGEGRQGREHTLGERRKPSVGLKVSFCVRTLLHACSPAQSYIVRASSPSIVKFLNALFMVEKSRTYRKTGEVGNQGAS